MMKAKPSFSFKVKNARLLKKALKMTKYKLLMIDTNGNAWEAKQVFEHQPEPSNLTYQINFNLTENTDDGK